MAAKSDGDYVVDCGGKRCRESRIIINGLAAYSTWGAVCKKALFVFFVGRAMLTYIISAELLNVAHK